SLLVTSSAKPAAGVLAINQHGALPCAEQQSVVSQDRRDAGTEVARVAQIEAATEFNRDFPGHGALFVVVQKLAQELRDHERVALDVREQHDRSFQLARRKAG